jgi:predicted chitinase
MMPHANSNVLNQYAPHLNKAMQDAGINTPARQNAFLAQLAHESGQFRYMQELASGKAYEGRKDLGNTSPGDGVKYKGRGPIQITGKANYAAAGKALGVDLVNHPELAATPEVGFRTAAWYWNTHGLNAKADQGTLSSFSQITKSINGCANCPQTHAAERDALWANNNRINP